MEDTEQDDKNSKLEDGTDGRRVMMEGEREGSRRWRELV